MIRRRRPARATGPDIDTREKVRWRDKDRCRRCGVPTWQIHHRQGRGGDDPHRVAALVLLCGSGSTGCHGYVHAHPAESYASGWMVRRLGIAQCEDVPMLTPDGWVLLNADGTTTPVKGEAHADVPR